LKANELSQLQLPFDIKKLDLQTAVNNITNAKNKEDSKDGIIGSALSGLGMSGENLALLKNIYSTAKEKLGIGDFKVGDKLDELKDMIQNKVQDVADGLQSKAQSVVDDVQGRLQSGMEDAQNTIQSGIDDATGRIQSGVNDFLGGTNNSEIEMTQTSAWQPQELQDMSQKNTVSDDADGEVMGLDADLDLSRQPAFASTSNTNAGTEAGTEAGEVGTEAGEAGLEAGEEVGEIGAEAGLEAVGAGLDATGILAPIGVALQLAGMGVSIYQAFTDGASDDAATQDANLANTAQEQEDKLKTSVQSQVFAGSNVLPSLSSTGLQSITSSFF
jgi:hypothetical protein